jgi:hypothetical protein
MGPALTVVLKWLRRMGYVLAVVFGVFALFLIVFASMCAFRNPEVSSLPDEVLRRNVPPNVHNRDLEDAYYSYPEWYIVWSYDERAAYLEKGSLPSEFPYFASIHQYWHGYCLICAITHSRHQLSMGGHAMDIVLGSSFAVEYTIRGAYERTIGSLSEWTAANQMVEEDAYASRVARELANFVNVRPFYEFHFAHALKGLWQETKFWGPHPLRKLERKAILSADYGLQAVYAEILEKLSHMTYGVESAETYTWIENAPESLFRKYPHLRRVKDTGERSYVVSIPRYQEFTQLVVEMAKDNVHFAHIAGNDEIMVSAMVRGWTYETPEERVLFFEPFLTRPDMKRVVLECRVRDLQMVLNDLASRGTIEHLYDY